MVILRGYREWRPSCSFIVLTWLDPSPRIPVELLPDSVLTSVKICTTGEIWRKCIYYTKHLIKTIAYVKKLIRIKFSPSVFYHLIRILVEKWILNTCLWNFRYFPNFYIFRWVSSSPSVGTIPVLARVGFAYELTWYPQIPNDPFIRLGVDTFPPAPICLALRKLDKYVYIKLNILKP